MGETRWEFSFTEDCFTCVEDVVFAAAEIGEVAGMDWEVRSDMGDWMRAGF